VSSLRTDEHSGELVAVSPGRGTRPGAATLSPDAAVRPRPGAPPCPFCEGHEERTPREILALGRAPGAPPDGPGWTVRVVPNLFPAIEADDGAHEVAAHGGAHRLRLAELADGVLGTIAEAWCRRALAHAASGRPAVLAGVNEGRRAGASLEHSHSQLLAMPHAPPRLAAELARAAEGADVLDTPLDGARVVCVDDGLVAYTPWAPRVGHELRVAPAEPEPDAYGDAGRLAAALRLAVAALDATLGPVPLNVIVHSRPAGLTTPFRWHLEVLPRLGAPALVEFGAGITVCSVDPETAAERYRDALARPR
jgi:UDPglucose--hexose-1-phosphate uridylyltransferase